MRRNRILRAYGTEYKGMTKRLLAAEDILSDILTKTGAVSVSGFNASEKIIALKPNLVCPAPAEFGGTTHPEIVAGILEYLLECGLEKERIVIMEGSWVGDVTEEAFDYCGYLSLQEHYGVRLIDTKKEKYTTVDCAGMPLRIVNCALSADYLINLPVIKGHCQTKMTCALKNMKGLIPDAEKRHFHQMGLHQPIAHVNAGIRPDLIVTDHICGDPDFEEGGNPLVRNCIMLAKDPVLMDSYACTLLGLDKKEVPYIGIAEKLGIGSSDLSGMDNEILEGESTENVPESHSMIEIAYAVDEVDSCSACYGTLMPALMRLKEEGLLEKILGDGKIAIGQGYRGKSGKIGVGNCTAGFAFCVRGCPPEEEEIYEQLKRLI